MDRKKQAPKVLPVVRRVRNSCPGGSTTIEECWNGERMEAVETTFRRVRGKVIKRLVINESEPHSTRDSMIFVCIEFTDGDSWSVEFEAAKRATAVYFRNRGLNTVTLDEVEIPGIHERRARRY